MKNIKLDIAQDVQEKLLLKHRIKIEELENALEYGNPRFFKQKGNTYMAIMHHLRYITLIFEYERPNIAKVRTAYHSPQSHINRYNKK